MGAIATAPLFIQQCKSSRLLCFDLARGICRHQNRIGLDVDFPGLQGLRDFADEIDRKETVFQFGAAHSDMIGELEPMLERTGRNAAVQVALRGCLLSLACHGQEIGLKSDVDLDRVKPATAIEI